MIDATEQDIWENDKLGRAQDAELVRRFLANQLEVRERLGQKKTYVLNLDSQWGGGKTFFLEHLRLELEEQGHVAAYVNVWASDLSDDPLVAVFSEVKAQLEKVAEQSGVLVQIQSRIAPVKSSIGKIVTKVTVGGLKQAIRRLAGQEGGSEILETLGIEAVGALGDQVVEAFEDNKATLEAFKSELAELIDAVVKIAGKEPPVFVLIDELDRCRPSWTPAITR